MLLVLLSSCSSFPLPSLAKRRHDSSHLAQVRGSLYHATSASNRWLPSPWFLALGPLAWVVCKWSCSSGAAGGPALAPQRLAGAWAHREIVEPHRPSGRALLPAHTSPRPPVAESSSRRRRLHRGLVRAPRSQRGGDPRGGGPSRPLRQSIHPHKQPQGCALLNPPQAWHQEDIELAIDRLFRHPHKQPSRAAVRRPRAPSSYSQAPTRLRWVCCCRPCRNSSKELPMSGPT